MPAMLGAEAEVPASTRNWKLPPVTTQEPPVAAMQSKYPSCADALNETSGV
jgi:hypothetical protein